MKSLIYLAGFLLPVWVLSVSPSLGGRSASGQTASTPNAGSPAYSKEAPPPSPVHLTCWDAQWHDYKSRSARSRQFISPDGSHRAYVTLKAQALGRDSEGNEPCVNRAALFISQGGANGFRPVLVLQGELDELHALQGNFLRLVDWSPDSRYLLLEEEEWTYETDTVFYSFVVYSVKSHSTVEVSPYSLISRDLQTACDPDEKALGFFRDGRVAVEISDESGDESAGCAELRGLWAIDWRKPTLVRAPQNSKIRRYGRFAERPLR